MFSRVFRQTVSKHITSRFKGLYVSSNCVQPKFNSNLQNVFYFHHKVITLHQQKDICIRTFHTSNQNKALPPVVWIVLRGILKFGAVITGRGLKKWWAALPKNKRQYILNEIKKNQRAIMVGAGISASLVYAYYVTHLVEDPITKRKKFLLFSENQIRQMSMIECEVLLETYKQQLVRSGFHYNYVLRIAQRILEANRELPGTNRSWTVIVIDDKDTRNAFVLPSGHIFIFTGMLATVDNDDQLAAIIGHEMAHALLCHSAEAASKIHLIEMIMLLPIIAIWTLLPDSVALTSHYFSHFITSVLFTLPFSRRLETEADTVGLEMISRACFDPRQASVFWNKMDKLAENEDIEWFSTHPSHKSRYEHLEGLMPKAFSVLSRHCTSSDLDPRQSRYR